MQRLPSMVRAQPRPSVSAAMICSAASTLLMLCAATWRRKSASRRNSRKRFFTSQAMRRSDEIVGGRICSGPGVTGGWICVCAAAAVVVTRLARDETFLLEPVEQPRQIVLRQQGLLLELERAQPSIGRAREFKQHVIPGKRRQASGFQVTLDCADYGLSRADQPG